MGYLIDRQKFWIKPAVKEIDQLMQHQKIDAIVSTFAPPAVHILASKIVSKYPAIRWIADYRDLWSQNHLMSTKGIFKVWERSIEKKAIMRASHLTTVSEPLVAELKELTKQKIAVSVIYNGFDTEIKIPEKRPEVLVIPAPVRIVYTGIIYKNRRDPAPFFRALKELKEEGIIKSGEVQIDFYGSANANLAEIITQCEASEWANIKGYVSYNEALRIQQEADYLLFLESDSKDAKGVLTGKLFEYLIAGKPILGIGIDETCASGQVINATNTGAVLGTDVALIKEHFRSLFVHNRDKTYNPDWKKIQEYSRNKQAEKMLSIINEVISTSNKNKA
jgi:glycosyltransferase involved in cell wall biosynthesis